MYFIYTPVGGIFLSMIMTEFRKTCEYELTAASRFILSTFAYCF